MRKTGYERKGFDGIEVLAAGIRLVGDDGKDNSTLDSYQNEVQLCREWLKEHASPINYMIRGRQSMYRNVSTEGNK